ncbi:uncharacterized protein LOC117173814 [Belonocnema kinseyi]|uniref:uncharacterized protein LOC117173814 n=1 Tax=Belonocnema kinseyi TaxID=2817044 RepID=UPI00143D7B4E|nr:uncharacterized protein LOC117173814 [Belonocnema kinseyi]
MYYISQRRGFEDATALGESPDSYSVREAADDSVRANVGTSSVTVIMMSMTNPVLDWLIPLNETRSRQGVFDAALPFDQTEHFYSVLLYATLTGIFANDLNSMYSPFLFITVVFNVGLLSTSGLGVLTKLKEPDTFIKYIAYTVGVFLHFYSVALPAQKLLDHSGDVSFNAYDICWYNMPSKSKRTILLLIQRSQEPCKLTAGKFYNMDMETFSAGVISMLKRSLQDVELTCTYTLSH